MVGLLYWRFADIATLSIAPKTKQTIFPAKDPNDLSGMMSGRGARGGRR